MPKGVYDRANVLADRSENPAAPAAPAASPRAETVRRERRKRQDGDVNRMARMKLAIPPEVEERLKREGKTARWVRDDPGRLQQLKAEDWELVQDVDSVSASRTDQGQMVLMEKYEDWYHSDRAHLAEQNKALESAAVKGKGAAPEVETDGFYTPQGAANRISHGG